MRIAEEARRDDAEGEGRQVGVKISWKQGNVLPSSNLWGKHSSEVENRSITMLIFEDDTTIVGKKDKKTSVIYLDPRKLRMTDHICYLNLGLTLTKLYSRYFNVVTPLSK